MDAWQKRVTGIAFAAASVPFVIYAAFMWATSDSSPESALREILNLDALPSSVSNLECDGHGITDLIIECAGDADPRDFRILMSGWPFEPLRPWPPGCGPSPRGGFLATECYIHWPPEFENGGTIDFKTNAAESRFYAKLYRE